LHGHVATDASSRPGDELGAADAIDELLSGVPLPDLIPVEHDSGHGLSPGEPMTHALHSSYPPIGARADFDMRPKARRGDSH
jgi:hypothetical protein